MYKTDKHPATLIGEKERLSAFSLKLGIQYGRLLPSPLFNIAREVLLSTISQIKGVVKKKMT